MKTTTSQERLVELFDSDPRNDTAIAEALGVSKQTISMWRHGTRSPKKSVLIKISECFNVSIEWLMGFDVEKNDDAERYTLSIDSKGFGKILAYMSNYCFEDYKTVIDIFNRTYEKMKKEGIEL